MTPPPPHTHTHIHTHTNSCPHIHTHAHTGVGGGRDVWQRCKNGWDLQRGNVRHSRHRDRSEREGSVLGNGDQATRRYNLLNNLYIKYVVICHISDHTMCITVKPQNKDTFVNSAGCKFTTKCAWKGYRECSVWDLCREVLDYYILLCSYYVGGYVLLYTESHKANHTMLM